MGGFQQVPGQPAPTGGGAGLGDIIGWLGGVLSGGTGGCNSPQQICSLSTSMKGWVSGYDGDQSGGISGFVHGIWDWVKEHAKWIYEHIIKKVVKWIKRIKARLHRILKPIIEYIKQEKQAWQWNYDHYIKPVLDFIQTLRRILAIFRLLHVKWATKLDNFLEEVQAEIERVVIGIREQLNLLTSRVNLILDPSGRFNLNIYLDTLQSSAKAAWGIMLGTQDAPAPDLTTPLQSSAWSNYSQPEAGSYASTSLKAGMQPDDKALYDQGSTMFNALGYQVF